MVAYPHLFFWTVSSALHFSKLIFPKNLHLSTICELKLQMRVGSLTPKAVQRLTVSDPPTIGLGLESSCEKVILTKEFHLKLETRFQQEPQLGNEERNMLVTAILIMLSSNVSWPISAPNLQPPCLCKGQIENHWKQLKSPKTVTEILISQNSLHHTVKARDHSDISPVQEAQLIRSNRDKKSLNWCLLEAVEAWMDMDFIVKLTQQRYLV